MKILQIVKSLGRGGAEMLLQETLKLHDKQQFDFHYIYFLPWKNQMVEGIEQAGGKVTNFPAKNNLFILLQIIPIIRYIRKNKIELIHCHLPWAGFAGRIIHLFTKIPVVYSEHNIQDRYHILTKTINRLTFNWQNKVIAVSGDVEQSIRKSIHPKIPVQTILNGINTEQFQRSALLRKQKREELGLKDGDILIGTIAVFRFQKRLKEWVEMIYKIRQKHPHVKACIVGDGPLKKEITDKITELGLNEHIIMPGLQSDVLPWHSAFDIFMMTSSFEGLPIALLEAMSMESAVVCTDAGGIKELIRNKQDGFLHPVDQWQDVQTSIDLLIQDPEKISFFGKAARKRVEDSFSMQSMVDQLEQLYLVTANQKSKADGSH